MLSRLSSRIAIANATRSAWAVAVAQSSTAASRRWASTAGEAGKEESAKKEGEAAAESTTKGKPQSAAAFEGQAELQDKVKQLEKEKDELKKDLLYTQADAENARRIGREDTEKARNFAVTSFAKSMLEVGDTLERAIESLEKLPQEVVEANKSLAAVLTGVKMSRNVLLSAFSKNGIEKMNVKVGTPFDPNSHDAIFNAPATDAAPAGSVLNVVKDGYLIKERVLRAAQVGVAQEQK